MKIAKNTVVSVAYKLSDAQGNVIWTRQDGSVMPVRWCADDAEDLLLYQRPDAPPMLVDGRLEAALEFEAADALLVQQKPPKEDPYAVADYGNILNHMLQDVDGDGVAETLFYNRETMWVYGGRDTEV